MDIGRLGIWFQTDALPAPEAARLAQRVEALGYGTFWFGEGFGRDPLAHAAYLLSQTSRLVVATGIASIYSRDALSMMGGANALAEQSGGRFLLGLGVSFAPLVEPRGHQWGPPVKSMREYLARMRQSPYASVAPEQTPPIVLAALGPHMLELAAAESDGAYPCNVTPEWTAKARERMGNDAWLCIDQKVILESNPSRAREIARAGLTIYLQAPHQQRNFIAMGFQESDFADGGSDRLVDALVAWGDEATLQKRIQAHFDAGATQVTIQPVEAPGTYWPNDALLEAFAPGNP
jgi:probable F420-dependent oxidoreductase